MTNSAAQIEAKFAYRRVDKVWRYNAKTLREFFERAVEHYGRVPLAVELEQFRRRELELARARGDDALQLPSVGPYRRRYGSYENACRHYGYTTDQLAERLERNPEPGAA